MKIFHEQLNAISRFKFERAAKDRRDSLHYVWQQALNRLEPPKDTVYFTHQVGTPNLNEPKPRHKHTYTRAIFPDGRVVSAIGRQGVTLQHQWYLFHRDDYLFQGVGLTPIPRGGFNAFPRAELLEWEAALGTPFLDAEVLVCKLEDTFNALEEAVGSLKATRSIKRELGKHEWGTAL